MRGWAKNASRTFSRSGPFQARLEHTFAQIDACTTILRLPATLQGAPGVAGWHARQKYFASPCRRCSVSSACLGAPFLAMMGIAHLAQGSVRGGNRRLGPAPRLPKSHASCGRNLALDSRRGGRGMTLSCFGKSFVHVHTSPCMHKTVSFRLCAWSLRADFIRNRIRDSFPRHDEHRTPRTGLSSWGEQAPRARASTASTCPHHLSGHDGGLR